MDPRYLASANAARASIVSGTLNPSRFRAHLQRVPPAERDTWLNCVLGIDDLADDGVDLPRGCSPYLPCPVEAVLRTVDLARVSACDVFVDIGSGVGRAALLVRLLTGASVIGIEVQQTLVAQSREYARQLNLSGVSVVAGDAAELVRYVVIGSVFFLYCPFGGSRLDSVLDGIEPIAKTRPLRICTVDLNLPPRAWLSPITRANSHVAVCRSTFPCRIAGNPSPTLVEPPTQ